MKTNSTPIYIMPKGYCFNILEYSVIKFAEANGDGTHRILSDEEVCERGFDKMTGSHEYDFDPHLGLMKG